MNSPLEYSQIEINKTYYNLDGDNVLVNSKSSIYENYITYIVVGTENPIYFSPYKMTELYNERPPQEFIDRYKTEKAKKISEDEDEDEEKYYVTLRRMKAEEDEDEQVPLCNECNKERAWQSICLNCYMAERSKYDQIKISDIYYINLSWAMKEEYYATVRSREAEEAEED